MSTASTVKAHIIIKKKMYAKNESVYNEKPSGIKNLSLPHASDSITPSCVRKVLTAT